MAIEAASSTERQKASEDLVSGGESRVPREQTVQFDFPCLDEGFWKTVFPFPRKYADAMAAVPPRLILWGRESDQVSQSLGGAQEHIQHGQAGHLTQECGPGEVAQVFFRAKTVWNAEAQCLCPLGQSTRSPRLPLLLGHLPPSYTNPPSQLLVHYLGSLGLVPVFIARISK